jgi:predicted aspartyl protease
MISERMPLIIAIVAVVFSAARPAVAENPIPLKIMRGIWIIVPVRINGVGPFNFLLDSGTNTTIIHREFARALQLKAVDRIELVTIAGTQIVPRSYLTEVIVGGVTALNIEALWSDLAEIRALDQNIHGVLGANFLKRFNYLIDYRSGRIEFEAGNEVERRLRGRRLPLVESEDRIIILATAGREKLRLVLDSGAPAIVLFAAARQRLSSNLRLAQDPSFILATDCGRQVVETAILSNLQIGDASWREVPVAIATPRAERREDGLLPMRLFQSIYINHRAGYAVLDPQSR